MLEEKKGLKTNPKADKSLPVRRNFFSKTYNLLFHEDIYLRIGGYLLFGLLLFLISWACFTFILNKTNLMQDTFMVQKIYKVSTSESIGKWGASHFGATWKIPAVKLGSLKLGGDVNVQDFFRVWGNVLWLTLQYFVQYLLIALVFIFFLNYFKIGKCNLGLVYFGIFTVFWGAVIGTDSLQFPTGTDKVFGPLVLFLRYGLWNWFSYLLLVAATTQFTWIAAPKWLASVWEKKRKFWPVRFTPDQREIFIYGLLFLLAASFAEARIFVHYRL